MHLRSKFENLKKKKMIKKRNTNSVTEPFSKELSKNLIDSREKYKNPKFASR